MAGFRSKVKKNVPKVALHSIWTLIVGGYKSGKTRLWKEVTELHYASPEEAMLICFEKGYETWELDNIIPVHEEGEDWQVWKFFREQVVKGLVEEAKNERVVKLIGIDTADRCIDACVSWLLHTIGQKYGKKFDSLQEVSTKTDENGWTLLYEELKRQFDALTNVGYGICTLAWVKEKETTLYDGKKYNSVELMMNNTARKVFESQASLICCLHNEVEILDASGNVLEENLTDKKGKEKATNFHKSSVKMHFRPSEYISIAGGRYTNLPEEPVEYSAENFLRVFEEAVLGQLKKTNTSVEDLQKQQSEEQETKLKELVQKEEQEKNQPEPEKTPKELIAEINAELKTISKPNLALLQKDFATIMNGDPLSYQKTTDTSLLQKCLEAVGKYK